MVTQTSKMRVCEPRCALLQGNNKELDFPNGFIETETLKIDHKISNFSLDILRLTPTHILQLIHGKSKIFTFN